MYNHFNKRDLKNNLLCGSTPLVCTTRLLTAGFTFCKHKYLRKLAKILPSVNSGIIYT